MNNSLESHSHHLYRSLKTSARGTIIAVGQLQSRNPSCPGGGGGGGGGGHTPHHGRYLPPRSKKWGAPELLARSWKLGSPELPHAWKWGSPELTLDTLELLCWNGGGGGGSSGTRYCEKCACVAYGWTSGWHSGALWLAAGGDEL